MWRRRRSGTGHVRRWDWRPGHVRRRSVQPAHPAAAPGLVALLAAALVLPGCASVLGGYDLAPSGLTRGEEAFRRDLALDPARAYHAALDGRRELPEDQLLRLLFAGTAARYAGVHTESGRLLDVASYLADDRVTLSLSREALSLVTSERVLPYVPGTTERLMIPYVAALNFLEAGQPEAAAVEARRLEALLDQVHDRTPPPDRPDDARFLHYFAGAVFEAAGDWGPAEVAYRRAGALADALGSPWHRNPGTGDGDGEGGTATGEVVILVERGFVPHRVEQSVIVVLPPPRARRLTDGSAADKATAAAEAAAHILLAAGSVYPEGNGFHRDHRYPSNLHLEPWRHQKDEDHDEDDDRNPYLLRVSWPVLYQERPAGPPLRIRAGDAVPVTVARFDAAAGIRRDFEDQRVATLARTVARAVSKLALTTTIEQSVANRDEGAGRLAGLLTNLGTLATERADTRAWHLLPGDIAMARLRLPAGSHDLSLAGDGPAGSDTPIATVTVRPGETTIVSARIWR
jgi:uncharacterized protein